MIDNILENVKTTCGITMSDTAFDDDLISKINAELFELNQIGIGLTGYYISVLDNGNWEEFEPDHPELAGAISQLVGLRVKLIFDPPTSSMAKESYEKTIDRLEWRLNVAVDPKE